MDFLVLVLIVAFAALGVAFSRKKGKSGRETAHSGRHNNNNEERARHARSRREGFCDWTPTGVRRDRFSRKWEQMRCSHCKRLTWQVSNYQVYILLRDDPCPAKDK